MSSASLRFLRNIPPISAGVMAFLHGTTLGLEESDKDRRSSPTNLPPLSSTDSRTWSLSWTPTVHATQLLTRSSKAYEHDPKDFDVYISNPTAEDLPVLLYKFDHDNLDVWPWIWTHPNENGPHHVFLGKTINASIVQRIQELRQESPQNNILVVIADDESTLEQAAKEAGTDASVFDTCHCGVVTGVKLQLLNVHNKILMLDDERVIAFDYLTIC